MRTGDELVECLPKDSWLHRWMQCWPQVEAPRSYLLFSALAMIGAMYGRTVWLKMDHRKLYPMLNLLLIGPSGVGKTTALEIGFDKLIKRLPKHPQIIAGKPSPEKLHWDLRSEPHSILYAEELASFITKQKYMESMVPYLTELLNYKDVLESRTKANDVVAVINPAVSFLGGSTIAWLQEQLPDSAVAGGFLPRFLIVYEQYKYQRCPLPDKSMGRSERAKLDIFRESVFQEFEGLVGTCSGAIEFRDYESTDVYTEWYSNHTPASGHLEPFAQRAGEFILRLSMLIALSCGRTSIEAEDIEAAIELQKYSEKSLQQVVVPYTQEGHMLNLILEAISTKELSEKQLKHVMRNHIASKKVVEYIESLVASGDMLLNADKKYMRT